jgi:hypothetical protein
VRLIILLINILLGCKKLTVRALAIAAYLFGFAECPTRQTNVLQLRWPNGPLSRAEQRRRNRNVKRNVIPEMLSTEMLLNLFRQNVLEIKRTFVRLKVTFFVRRDVLTSAGRIGANVWRICAVFCLSKLCI